MGETAPHAPLEEIEWRIDGKVDNGGGVRVVPYLDVPIVTRLLDEWVGPWRWKTRYEASDKPGVMWCHLSVASGKGEWVSKPDVGTASNFEADKGIVSDALKRVAMRQWGIGRNVFDLPILRLPQGKFRSVQDRNGNTQAYLTDESMTWIAGELKRRGFADAAEKAESAPVPEGHTDDEPEPQPEGETEEPFQPEQPAMTAAQEHVAKLVTGSGEQTKEALGEWWNEQGLPKRFPELSDEQCQHVMAKVDELEAVPF